MIRPAAVEYARYAIIAHVVHLVNRDYEAMCWDYYTLEFMDPSIDTSPIAPALANFFDNVLENSVAQLNFKSLGMFLRSLNDIVVWLIFSTGHDDASACS